VLESQLKIEDMNGEQLIVLAFLKEQHSGLNGELALWRAFKQQISR
jgi:hypothetical protein